MNILKFGLVLLTGAGFGFGVDKIADTDFTPMDRYGYEDHEGRFGHMGEGYCDEDSEFLEHLLSRLSDEDVILVNAKIEELYITYDTNAEALQTDYELRYDFMNDLMDFMEDSNIEFSGHGFGFNRGGHMFWGTDHD